MANPVSFFGTGAGLQPVVPKKNPGSKPCAIGWHTSLELDIPLRGQAFKGFRPDKRGFRPAGIYFIGPLGLGNKTPYPKTNPRGIFSAKRRLLTRTKRDPPGAYPFSPGAHIARAGPIKKSH